ncbi:MAG TPA: polymer-forming cytoskeletal protein [Myxococcota bacterium]|nr:polymer-forming cytoskeletal protein [Myxococcota bacterium]
MEERTTGWRRFVTGAAEPELAEAKREVAPTIDTRDAALISQGVEMSGRLVVPHSLRIEGEIRGELESGGSVFVSETGAVEAPIKARAVEIHGAVVGDIVATREVVIHATGRLHGDVETPSLVVMRGATFNGRTRMYRPERNVQPPVPETRA